MDRLGRWMASNREMDLFMQQGGHRIGGARTGTFIIKEGVDRPFDKKVEFFGLTYAVPAEFQGLANRMLVFEHREGFRIDEKGFVTGNVVAVIDRPVFSGWQEVDPETGIPNGREAKKQDPGARYWYGSKGPSICSITRSDLHVMGLDVKFYVTADSGPEQKFWAAWLDEPHNRTDTYTALLRTQDTRDAVAATIDTSSTAGTQDGFWKGKVFSSFRIRK
jgi:hypothetical protein